MESFPAPDSVASPHSMASVVMEHWTRLASGWALKAITRSESYLCAMKAGACRYDTEGYVTEHISQEEEAYAAARLDKIRRQNRIKAELQAVLDEK